MDHTPGCTAALAAHQAAAAAFAASFPHACKLCHGAGGKTHPGDRETPPEYEPCGDCLEQGKCPGCGESPGVFNDWCAGVGAFENGAPPAVLTCTLCGWTDDGSTAEPEGPECCCWEVDPESITTETP